MVSTNFTNETIFNSFSSNCEINELNNKRPFVSFSIAERPINFLLDTGASLSLLDYDTALMLPFKISPTNKTATSASGHNLAFQGSMLLPLRFGDDIYWHELLLTSNPTHNILGMDFLRKYDA